MSNILENILSQAKALNKCIVLPEGEDARVVVAASETAKQGLAKVVVLGNKEEIAKANPTVDLSGFEIIDPVTYDKTVDYAKILFDARAGNINKKTGESRLFSVCRPQ